MRIFILFFIAGIVMITGLTSCEKTPQQQGETPTHTETFVIDGISLGTHVETVISKFGTPISVKNSPCFCDTCETWKYDGFWFFIDNAEVWGLSSQTDNMCLHEDICPNDDIAKIFKRIGEVSIVPATTDKPRRLEYISTKHDMCWMWVFLYPEVDKIQEIRLACQP